MTTTALSPDAYAAAFAFDLEKHDLLSARSTQSHAGTVGVSDIGGCREKVRRMLVGARATDSPDKTAAIIGTYVDAGIKAARAAANPNLILDAELTVTLPGGTYTLPGHADEIDPDEPAVTDYKSKAGLQLVRRVEWDQQHRYQVHLYYLGALQAGLVRSEHGTVRDVYVDRSGKDPHPVVKQEPFSMAVCLEAEEWLKDATYAAKHGEEASKDKPRTFCEKYCEFFSDCQGRVPDADAHLSSSQREVLSLMVHADEQQRSATALYEECRDELKGVTGKDGVNWIRSSWVNAARGPYWKVTVGRVAK